MVYLTRRERFNGAHILYNKNWSEEKNREVFGKCSNKNYHGHNFDVFVTVKGRPDADTGFVMNAHELSRIIKDEVCERLDHKNFNLDIPEFAEVFPTTENVAIQIWNWIKPLIKGCELHSVKLQETENIYVEYFGEE
ncbi:MAG: 6-carboxytetrahydropterin synthase [Chitinophagales bacterium]